MAMALASDKFSTGFRDKLVEQTREIHDLLTGREFRTEKAREKVRQLYDEGIFWFIHTLQAFENEKPLPLCSSVVPVILQLKETLCLGSIQFEDKLIRALSKTYRLFFELTWLQCVVNPKLPSTSIKSALTPGLEEVISLSKNKSADSRFEIWCAEQASKSLTPTQDIVVTYVQHGAGLAQEALSLNPSGFLAKLKEFFLRIPKDWIAKSYIDTFHWRWAVSAAKPLEELEQIDVAQCLAKEEKYSICLTLVFMSILKSTQGDPRLHSKAFEGLKQLLSLEQTNWQGTSPIELAKKIINKPDRFWNTRSLAMKYLYRLTVKKQYQQYQVGSIEAIKSRCASVKDRPRYAVERQALASFNQENEQKLSTIKQETQVLYQQIQPFIPSDDEDVRSFLRQPTNPNQSPTNDDFITADEFCQSDSANSSLPEELKHQYVNARGLFTKVCVENNSIQDSLRTLDRIEDQEKSELESLLILLPSS